MSNYNFFDRVSVTNVNFSDHTVAWGFISSGLILLNESTTSGSIIQYSFNGTDVHGDLDPDLASVGLAFNNRHESRIWLRLKSAGSAITVRVEAWG